MAIDYNTGINSIDVGAHDITYSGNEGPKSPEQKQMMAFDDTPGFELKPLRLLIDEYEADHNGESPTSIDDLRRYFYSKYGPEGIAQVEQAVQREEQQAQMQEQREGIQMASAADPMLQEEYDKYVFEMQEQGLEPMSLEDFRRQAVAGMATGGRVPDVGFSKVQPSKDGSRPGYFQSWQAEKEQKEQRQAADRREQASVASTMGKTAPTPQEVRSIVSEGPDDRSTAKQTYEHKKVIGKLGRQDPEGGGPTGEGTIYYGPGGEIIDVGYQGPLNEREKVLDKFQKHRPEVTPWWMKRFQGFSDWTTERNRRWFVENVLRAGKYGYGYGDITNFEDLEEEYQKYMSDRMGGKIDAYGNVHPDYYTGPDGTYILKGGDDSWNPMQVATGPVPPPGDPDPDPDPDPDIPTGSATLPYTVDPNADDLTQGRGGWFYNDGGRVGYAGGGIADLRQGYFLGKIVKAVTKPFKGITRGAKKLMKSPWAKAALLAGLGVAGHKGMLGDWATGWFGKEGGLKQLAKKHNWLGSLLLGDDNKFSPWKLGIMGAAALPMLGFGQEDEDENKMYEDWLREKAKWDATYKAIPTTSLPSPYSRYLMGAADGGRIGYAGGYMVDDEEEDTDYARAIRALSYRPKAQEGGLMDLGGMEKDYRNEGGFVPIGGQERADDVPARLSKNEFVFTADAVRAAGGGDIDKGAEIMENVMENLEQGGNISEESQGLEGARDMFATSQRLEGVL